MNDFTQLLAQIKCGDQHAAIAILPIVDRELRELAAAKMDIERPDHALQPTALVHEAYPRLIDPLTGKLGIRASTFSPPPPKPCDASWWNMHEQRVV